MDKWVINCEPAIRSNLALKETIRHTMVAHGFTPWSLPDTYFHNADDTNVLTNVFQILEALGKSTLADHMTNIRVFKVSDENILITVFNNLVNTEKYKHVNLNEG